MADSPRKLAVDPQSPPDSSSSPPPEPPAAAAAAPDCPHCGEPLTPHHDSVGALHCFSEACRQCCFTLEHGVAKLRQGFAGRCPRE